MALDEETKNFLTEMRAQNANILTTMGAVQANQREHGDKFERVFDALKKINRDIDGNGDYKKGLRFKLDQVTGGLDELRASERNCPGRNPMPFRTEVLSMVSDMRKEVTDTLQRIEDKALMNSSKKLGAQEERERRAAETKAERDARRAKMKTVERWLEIAMEAPLRSAGYIIFSLALSGLLTFCGVTHKHMKFVDEKADVAAGAAGTQK